MASDTTRRGITTALALTMLLASLGTSIANIALPALSQAFSASLAESRWVVVAYLGGLTASTLIAGHLGDRYGPKHIHIVGLALFSVASLACGFASSLWFLIAARAFQGVGAAFLMTLSMALMRDNAGDAGIGRAMGLLGTVSALGTALGPSLGGILIAATGWRGIFLIQVPVAAFALILCLVVLPANVPGAGRSSRELPPVLMGRLAPCLSANLMVAAVMMATLVVGPFYLGPGLGLIDLQVGLVMSVGPLISILCGIPSGRLVDAIGARRVVWLGLAMLTAGTLLLALLPEAIGVSGYILAIAILTPGYQLFQAANNTRALADTAADLRGAVSGLLGLSRNIGLIAGAYIMAAIFAFGVGTEEYAHAGSGAIASGMQLTLTIACGLMLAAMGVMSVEYAARDRQNGM
ncbi:MFS transporter [Ancylobacter sonchi]